MPKTTRDLQVKDKTFLDYTNNGRIYWHLYIEKIFEGIKKGKRNLPKAYQEVYKCSNETARTEAYSLLKNPRFASQLKDYMIAHNWTKETDKAGFIDVVKRAKDSEALIPEIQARKEIAKLNGSYPDQKLRIEGNLGLYQMIQPEKEDVDQLEEWSD